MLNIKNRKSKVENKRNKVEKVEEQFDSNESLGGLKILRKDSGDLL